MIGAVWLNGRLVDEVDAVVSVRDRGLLLGDGLFETMRAYGGRVFALHEHLDRLRVGAARIAITLPDGLADAVSATLAASGLADAAVRLTVTRGCAEGDGGLLTSGSAAATAAIIVRRYEPATEWYDRGVRAAFAPGRLDENRTTAGLKHLGYLEAILALNHARSLGCDDAVFLDTSGHIAEAATSNVFVVVDDTLITPPLSCGIVPGITRATVLRLAAGHGCAVREEPLTPEVLAGATEAFLTSSLREIVPLIAVDGVPIGVGRPGPLTQRVLADYRDLANQ